MTDCDKCGVRDIEVYLDVHNGKNNITWKWCLDCVNRKRFDIARGKLQNKRFELV